MTADVTLTTALLGLKPYVLIEAAADPDGELVLSVSAGGGAEERMEALPYMFVSELPAGTNPITMGIADLFDQHPDVDRDTVVKLADILGVPMPEVAR